MFWSLRPTGRMPWIIREVKHHVYVKRQTPFCATCPSPLFTCRLLFPISQWYIQGRGRGAAPPPLFLDQNEAQRAKNISLRPAPPPPPTLLILESGWPGPALFWRSGSATVSTPKLEGSGNFFIHKSCLQLYLSVHFLFWRNSHLESDVCRLSYTWSLNSLFCVLGDFYASGRQGTEVREYLLILFLS